MDHKLLCIITIFIIILILIIVYYWHLHNSVTESFGVYCGRYNMDKTNAQINCNADKECIWRDNLGGWCDENGNMQS